MRQRLLEAKALERAGAYTDGVTLAQEVVSDARALGDRAVLAESELRLGSLYNLAGRYADAERELIAAHNDARWSRHDGVAIEAVLKSGDPRDVVVETAKELGCDLIVIGTHGRRGIARALLGSVAESVLRTAPVPVLAIRAGTGEKR